MGRHADPRAGRRTRAAAVTGVVALVVLVVAGLVVWRVTGRADGSAAMADGCGHRATVRVTVAPELSSLVGDLLAHPQPLGDGACAVAEVSGQEPLQTVAALAALDADALPQVWVPDSSLWVARAGTADLATAGSVATSPLVLATSRAAADQLGWTRSPPTWGAALATGRPVAVPDLAASAEGLTVLAAVRRSLGGGADADNAVVRAVLAAGRGEVPSPAEALRAGSQGGPDAPLVPVSEQEVIAANTGGDGASLVAVYPREGSPSLDYPAVRVGPTPEEVRPAVDAVLAALTSEAARAQVLAAGFRDDAGSAPEDAGPDTGVQARAPVALQLDPAALQSLLARLTSLATPSRLLTVIDVSTSMSASAGDGGTRASLARDATKSALTLLPDSYAGGLWVFGYHLDGDRDWTELAPLRTFGADAGNGGTQRQLLVEQFDSIPGRLAPGGTGLYDTTLAAVRAARDAYDPHAVSSVVLITDGDNDDDASGVSLATLLDTLRAEADPARPVKVVGIGLGPDADLDALRQIADATAGAAYQALDPQDLQSVLFDAIRRRG